MMKISKWEAQERYREIIDSIDTIMTLDDIRHIEKDVKALRVVGAWWHARLADRKLKDEVTRRAERLDNAFNPDG